MSDRSPTVDLVDRCRRALADARRAGDEVTAAAARSLISAVQHAEAEGVGPAAEAPTAGPIAGAVTGLGATEVARRVLDEGAVRAVVAAEVAERHTTAEQLERLGRHDAAARLRVEAAAIAGLAGPSR